MDIIQHTNVYWQLFAASQTKTILNFFSDLHVISCNDFFYITVNQNAVFRTYVVFINNK